MQISLVFLKSCIQFRDEPTVFSEVALFECGTAFEDQGVVQAFDPADAREYPREDVAIGSDRTVFELKGRPTIHTEGERGRGREGEKAGDRRRWLRWRRW